MKKITIILIFISISILNVPNFSQRSILHLMRYAERQMKVGKYTEAIDVLNKYIAQNPQKADGYNLRGLCYEAQGIYKNAVLDFRRAISIEPNNNKYKNNLKRVIKVWYKILNEKIKGHKREISINPQSAVDYLEIAKCYRWMEKWQLSEQWYDKYLKLDPNASPDEIIRYTIVLTKTKHIKKGERILKKYVERYPDDWRLWSRYGYFTLWLGKYKVAENAFRTALSFKPYFKEAEDGLELAIRKAYLVQYQPRDFEKVYWIDRYYKKLSREPDNDNIRFKLVRELINKKRFQEAKDQLSILSKKYRDDERFLKLKKLIENHFNEQIIKTKTIVNKDSTNRKAIFDLAKNYMYLEKYDDAINTLQKYLELMPDDLDAKYLLAKSFMLKREYTEAYEIILDVINSGGNKIEYKLLAGQLGVWALDATDTPKIFLEEVLEEQPQNINALTALGLFYYNKDNPDSLKYFLQLAEEVDAQNPDVKQLKNMYQLLILKKDYEKYLKIVAKADSLYHESKFEDAIKKYNEYFSKPSELNMEDYPVYLSLASAYLAINKYDSAALAYDKALQLNDNKDIRIQKAKSLFWAGDSTKALEEFKELVEKYPNDAELKVFLGDSYLRVKDFDNARESYVSVPDSLWEKYSIEKRISWLPPEQEGNENSGFFSTFYYDFFSYLYLNPNIYYFNDILDFNYGYVGISGNTGIFSFLSAGAGYRYGILSDAVTNNFFQRFMFYFHFLPTDKLKISLGMGKMFNDFYYNRKEYETSVSFADSGKYDFSLSFIEGDGAEILYSPYLVTNKITAQNYKFEYNYNFGYNLLLYGYWSFLHALPSSVSGNNWGNDFLIRAGRYFSEDYLIGYEFNFIDYQYSSVLYYSPQNFTSHSIWGKWNFYKDSEWNLFASGKLGYVPEATYFIWDLKLDAKYKPLENLSINGFLFFSQSQRYFVGYRSRSFGINLSWTPF